MATRLQQSEELRKRLEQGKQARERVLSGQYNKVTPTAQASVNPRTAAVQQYVASRPSLQDFPKEITNIGADRIKESTLFKATQGKTYPLQKTIRLLRDLMSDQFKDRLHHHSIN